MSWRGNLSWLIICVSLFTVPVKANPEDGSPVTANVVVSVLGASEPALALQDLVYLVLNDSDIKTTIAPPPTACRQPDDPACLNAVLASLNAGYTTVAIISVSAINTHSAWDLRERGIEELGEITPASRRSCLATSGPAKSILDLTEPSVADIYNLQDDELNDLAVNRDDVCKSINCTPQWCKTNTTCATLLTSTEIEAKVLTDLVNKHHLYAVVRPFGSLLSAVSRKLSKRSIIVCDWAPEIYLENFKAAPLATPACLSNELCPFETRRFVKYVNIRELAYKPSAVRSLFRLQLRAQDLKELNARAYSEGHENAAKYFFDKNYFGDRFAEIRAAVLLPNATDREAYDSRAMAAAAALAEEDFDNEGEDGLTYRFKVETYDDGCHRAGAYKYLDDARGTTDFVALSGIAGPACGAAWAEVANHVMSIRLPMLAFTPQAPSPAPAGAVVNSTPDLRLQLLFGGDSREGASALGSFVNMMKWRRVAVLSEPATRPLVDKMHQYVEFAVHKEVLESVDLNIINEWASKASSANAHIIYLCVEDVRLARAAVCSARKYGTVPTTGAVWMLCQTPPADWLTPASGENCTQEQLEETVEGYLTATPDWQLNWEDTSNITSVRRSWEARWRSYACRIARVRMSSCNVTAPDTHAALLYDTLKIWAYALQSLLKNKHSAIDDLHSEDNVKSLIEYATTNVSNTLTGPFVWVPTKDAYVRQSTYIVSQWDPEQGFREVGQWKDGTLSVDKAAIKWYTTDSRIPDDGGDQCGLQGFANALNTDCRTAYIALGVILAAILIAVLTATAIHCKRRAEREYKARLAALGMRPLAIKPNGLDRWEIPREKVVINRKLGTGAFGTVYGGQAKLSEEKGWTAVAVKTLKAGANNEEKLDFLAEAEAMKRFDHKNVVRLLAVVTKTEPVCTVMELMLYGDLKNYLLARRHLAMGCASEEESADEADEVSPERLTGMALDVARALSYLAQLRYVHRDVAARNCLISSRRVVKLADFGMTRLVFENDYYRLCRKGMLPVRWMAPESLDSGIFTPASDVWSFGVLLYEIVTFGSLPFQGLSNAEVLARVKSGYTIELPSGLKPQLEGLINSCWKRDNKKRPTASEVAAFLADSPRLLNPCLDIPLDALSLDSDPPWKLPRDQAEARWVSWAVPASAATDSTYISTDGNIPLDTDSFLP